MFDFKKKIRGRKVKVKKKNKEYKGDDFYIIRHLQNLLCINVCFYKNTSKWLIMST